MTKVTFRIGLDMRMAGEGFGIGKYILELVSALLRRQSNFHYVLFFDKNFNEPLYREFLGKRADCRLVTARYYSLEEQIKLPRLLSSEKLDLVHFPNFNVPVFYRGKFIVTVHDLIHHHFPGRKKRNWPYRLAYRLIINTAVRRAKKIIAVSQATKSDIIKLLGIPPGKISVVYEGVSSAFSPADADSEVLKKHKITKPFVLAVGVWRQYKNLPVLAQAYSQLRRRYGLDYQLVLVGEEDKNYPEIRRKIFSFGFESDIITTGNIGEIDLVVLYRAAACYVSPSLSEGFGLTSLEAQACATAVVSSDIAVAREVLGDSVAYFDPRNIESLTEVLKQVLSDHEYKKALIKRGLQNASKYTWDKTAEATERIYESLLRSLPFAGESRR